MKVIETLQEIVKECELSSISLGCTIASSGDLTLLTDDLGCFGNPTFRQMKELRKRLKQLGDQVDSNIFFKLNNEWEDETFDERPIHYLHVDLQLENPVVLQKHLLGVIYITANKVVFVPEYTHSVPTEIVKALEQINIETEQ